MLRDMQLFKAKLEHIDGFGDTGDYLTGIIKSKQVKSASPPPNETKSENKAALEDTTESKEQDGDSEEKKPAEPGLS
jgi:vacuolar protein sorting-associated protein 54